MPKSMAPVNGRPFLEYLFDDLISQGIERVVLSVGFKHELISGHFGERYRSLTIQYAVENEPLGTGGGIRLAMWKVEGPRAVTMNGDSLFRINIRDLVDFHIKKKADATLALRKLNDTARYGRVNMNRARRIIGFEEKGPAAGPGYINGGVYVIEKLFLMEPEFRGRFSIEKDCFGQFHQYARMYGFPSGGYFLDIGIPEDYKKAEDEFAAFGD
jgi:D-glycero-alpha-D-manno-heptose 1-phosphate guanylyltransferase